MSSINSSINQESQIVCLTSFENIQDDNSPQPQKKRNRTTIQYETAAIFDELEEAKQFIKNEKLWQFKFRSRSEEGNFYT